MENTRKKLIEREEPKSIRLEGTDSSSIKPLPAPMLPPDRRAGRQAGVKIINIRLGNRDEMDEVRFMDKLCNTYIVFCGRVTEKAGNNKNPGKLSCNDVLNYLNANLYSLDIYSSDGQYIK